MDVHWTLVKLKLTSEKRFFNLKRRSNPQPSDDRWDALTIKQPKLRCWAKVQVRYMCCLCGSLDMLTIQLNATDIYIYKSIFYRFQMLC